MCILERKKYRTWNYLQKTKPRRQYSITLPQTYASADEAGSFLVSLIICLQKYVFFLSKADLFSSLRLILTKIDIYIYQRREESFISTPVHCSSHYGESLQPMRKSQTVICTWSWNQSWLPPLKNKKKSLSFPRQINSDILIISSAERLVRDSWALKIIIILSLFANDCKWLQHRMAIYNHKKTLEMHIIFYLFQRSSFAIMLITNNRSDNTALTLLLYRHETHFCCGSSLENICQVLGYF